MEKDKASLGAALAVASVWFATHFGGGFSSARQVVEFYTKFGPYAIFMPIVAIALEAIFFYYAWCLAVSHKSFNYRKWALDLYTPYEKVGAIIYEIIYLLIAVVATAVAFATGGSVLNETLGMNYYLATAIVALIIFIVTVFGAEAVRRFSTGIAIIGVSILIIIYAVVTAKNWSHLTTVIHTVGFKWNTFWHALWWAILYAGFQTAAVGSYISVAEVLKTKKDCYNAALFGFVLNMLPLWLCATATLAFYPNVLSETVPALYVVQHSLGTWGKYLISFLIFIGVISTGVPLTYGTVKRILYYFEKRITTDKMKKVNITATALFVILTWIIALAGLIPLIAKGYQYIGYISVILLIPVMLYKGIRYNKKWWRKT